MAIRKLPQNIEAEMEILGSAFLSNYALEKSCEELNADMFFSDKNRKIFEAIKNLYDKRVPLDVTTITNELEKMKYID